MLDNKYIYVFVREDLDPGVLLVQSVHAAIQVAKEGLHLETGIPNVIALGVADEEALLNATLRLSELGVGFHAFTDSDLPQLGTTSVVTYPTENQKKNLAEYRLYPRSFVRSFKVG
jgi:hypothetical protein